MSNPLSLLKRPGITWLLILIVLSQTLSIAGKPSLPKRVLERRKQQQRPLQPQQRHIRSDLTGINQAREGALVLSPGTVAPLGTYGYILACTNTLEAAIIDPGGRVDAYVELLKKHKLKATHILLTHEHLDHIAGVAEAKEATGAPVYLHWAGVDMYNIKGVPLPFASYEGLWRAPIFRRVVDRFSEMLLGEYPQPPAPDYLLSEGDSVLVGELELKVLHLPGHSRGSVAFIEPDQGVVFAGDAVMGRTTGRTDLPGASGIQMYVSLAKLRSAMEDPKLMPIGTMLYTGHVPPVLAAEELARNPALQNRNEFIVQHVWSCVLLWGVILGLPAFLLWNLGTNARHKVQNKRKVKKPKKEEPPGETKKEK